MKINSYALIFIGLLAVQFAKNAEALTNDQENLCKVFGDAAYQIALMRDEGHNRYETRNRIIRNFDKSINQAILLISDIVYDKPWRAAEQEADYVVKACIDQFERRLSL